MKQTNSALVLLLLAASLVCAQAVPKVETDPELQRAVLLSEVRTLALEVPKLDDLLSRALANAEIADAAWTLDRQWAKSLLTEAYHLTYLTEDERRSIGSEPPGTAPRPPTALARARIDVRKRIVSVARRDKAFADHLLGSSSTYITKDERQMMYAQMTTMALDEGDTLTAVHSIQENIAIDPSQLMLAQLVNDLARKDRAAADKLIVEFMTALPNVQLAGGKLSRARAEVVLRWLVFPNSFFPNPEKPTPNPGAEVMRAYVVYVIDSFTTLEQADPESLPAQRSLLLSAWLPLNQYAPELKERFMQLEAASRTPGKDASLPTKAPDELDQELFRKRQTEALNSNAPNDQAIESMIAHGEFETARKLIEKLTDGEKKSEFTEKVNTREAISLAKNRDLIAAQSVAERLTTSHAIWQVYSLIIQGYATKKDQVGAASVVQQAVKQTTRIRMKPPTTDGRRPEFLSPEIEVYAVLPTLAKLAEAVLPIDTLLAADLVDEMVAKTNRAPIDTSQGRSGINSALFRSLAARDEVRASTAARSFKDRLQRIVATAAVYQYRAKELVQ